MSTRQPNNSLQTPRRNRQRPFVLPTSHLRVPPRDALPRLLGQDRLHPSLGKVQVLSQEFVLQYVVAVRIVILDPRTDAGGVRGVVSRTRPDGVGPVGIAPGRLVLLVGRFVVVVIVVAVVSDTSLRILILVSANDMRGDATIVLRIHLVEHDE